MNSTLHGANIIEGKPSALGAERVSPHRGDGPAFIPATTDEVARAATAAAAYEPPSREARAVFLERIAEEIEGLGDALLERAHVESALPMARLTGERARTCGQLRMFAGVLRGEPMGVRIEAGDPARTPLPKPELKRTLVPLGPVAVFGASNFPLAFSVAGGDTASALAAGCAVIVKAHPSHPGTSEMTANAVVRAAVASGVPAEVFGMVHGGPDVGRELVLRPEIAAVGFTGSQAAGRALFDLAAGRPRPIPVYAEMGSVNPVFLLPGALAERGAKIAEGYAASLTAGVGQFCTNPGVVVGLASAEFEAFLEDVTRRLETVPEGTMLNEGIHDRYLEAVGRLAGHGATETCFAGAGAFPALFAVSAERFLAHPELHEEAFGPAAIAVRCADADEMLAVARALVGQLTATVHFAEGDPVGALLPLLVRMAGRIVANGFPTGVEVNAAMQHGGPYPATTDSRTTSVGTAAIERFLRPVAFQDFPAGLLPEELREP